MNLPDELADERYCYLSTQGRVTGRRHTAELWFVPTEGGVYLMSGSGGLTQWCLNLQQEEQGVLRVGHRSWLARVAFLTEHDPDRIEALEAFHDSTTRRARTAPRPGPGRRPWSSWCSPAS